MWSFGDRDVIQGFPDLRSSPRPQDQNPHRRLCTKKLPCWLLDWGDEAPRTTRRPAVVTCEN